MNSSVLNHQGAYFGIHPRDGIDFPIRVGYSLATRSIVAAATVPATRYLIELTGNSTPTTHLLIANVVGTIIIALFQAYADNQLNQIWTRTGRVAFELTQFIAVMLISSVVHVGCGMEFTLNGVAVVSAIAYVISRIAYTMLRILLSKFSEMLAYAFRQCKATPILEVTVSASSPATL